MQRIPVQSSNINAIGYDFATRTLEIEFKNMSVYQYLNVSPGTYNSLRAAESKGKYFASYIKDKYKAVKV